MIFKMRLIILAVFVTLLTINIHPGTSEKDWHWTSTKFTPIEGIGFHGTFKVNVVAKIEKGERTAKIVSIALWVECSVFQQYNAKVAASLSIIKEKKILKTVNLVRPPKGSSFVEREPKYYESRSLYLPRGTTIDIPKGSVIKFSVTPGINANGTFTTLGTSNHTINPME